MDVRDDTAARDGGLDQRVELLVTTDGELQVARRDALDAQVLGRVTRELEHLGARAGRRGVRSSAGAWDLMEGRLWAGSTGRWCPVRGLADVATRRKTARVIVVSICW